MSCSLFEGEISTDVHNMLLATSTAFVSVASDNGEYDGTNKRRMEEYVCCLQELFKRIDIDASTRKRRLHWHKTLKMSIDNVMEDDTLGKDYLATIMFSPAGQFSVYRNNRHRILEPSVFQEAVMADEKAIAKAKGSDLKVHTMSILDDKKSKSILKKAFRFFNVGEGDDRRHVTIRATEDGSKIHIDTVKTFEYMGSKFLLVFHHDNNRKAPALVINEDGEAYVGKRRYHKGTGKVKTQGIVDSEMVDELLDVLEDPKSACEEIAAITSKCPFSGETVEDDAKYIPKMGKLYGYKSTKKSRNSLESILR
jgi:hypothetical protein